MKGTIIVIGPTHTPWVVECSGPPELAVLQGFVGGYIEAVPNFKSILWPPHSLASDNETPMVLRRCVAFCNEDGKANGLPRNNLADLYWSTALTRDFGITSCLPDYLVGTIVVLYGDDEFMEAL